MGFNYIRTSFSKKLNAFSNLANFQPKNSTSLYDEYNRNIGNKLRIHLCILLSGFNAIYFKQKQLTNKGVEVKNILSILEIKIIEFISQNYLDNPSEGKIDIFSDHYETHDFELIPLIGIALNRFSTDNKKIIITAFTESNSLIKNLKLLDYISSETDYQAIISLVKNIDIATYFESLYSLPNIQYALSQLSRYDFFIEKSEEALEYWETKVERNPRLATNESKIFTFRIKLLHIYHKGTVRDVDTIEDPDINIHSDEFLPHHERNFYKALLSLKEGLPNEAYTIYDNLVKSSPQSPVLGLNRFAAKVDWAKKTADLSVQKNIAQSAIDEWIAYENTLSDVSLDFIKEKITYNTLVCYELLGNEIEFDLLYQNLEKSIQLKQEFLQLRIENLAKRKLIEQAEKTLFEAKSFHVLSNGSMPNFIDKLDSLIDIKDQLEYLQYQYSKIFSKSSKDLVQIIPDNINKSNNIPDFLLQEIVYSGANILDYINSISEINYEDKFSDLLSLALNSKLNFYGWHFGPTRGGFASTLRFNPGEIDIAIYSQREKLAICEAFKLSGKDLTKTQEHCEKVFNYDPLRKCFYIIIFYEGGTLKFAPDWEIYKSTIEKEVLYPEPYELISIDEISEEFDIESIKVAKCTHNNNIPLYHIYINMKYLVT
ncbi:MAG: hypothetical protein M0D57_10560 [Sphingobacteriales bacterium JAD_PAG50586_3]|nr:MAG: hypothetical protein M0D57_10560 [Sphingobacteriales bacterium JAD_PAG50586_3]